MLQFTRKEQRKIVLDAIMNGYMYSMCRDLVTSTLKYNNRLIDDLENGFPIDWIDATGKNIY